MDIEDRIIDGIKAERQRHRILWGEQNHEPVWWLTILMEEVGEACRGAWERKFRPSRTTSNYREEMIHVAAVALAALESFDRNESA